MEFSLIFIIAFVSILVAVIIYTLISRMKSTKNHELRTKELQNKIDQLENTIQNLSDENLSLHKDNVAKREQLGFLREQMENQSKDLEETRKTLSIEFKNLANEILEEKTKKFTEQNSTRLNEILVPFKEQIKGFEKRVEDTYEKSLKDQTDLQAELKKLQELNLKISTEAQNLTKALKGDVKKQGNWGEMILERILERSGLTKGQEYEVQESLQSQDGKRIQPDVVVHLPDEKHILIDSKVSLIAYERFVNEDNLDKQPAFLKEHILSIRRHVKELAEKNYQSAKGIQSPDFVLLFIPIEASFSIAIQEDQALFNEAWDKKIVIVSPTTLLATLMTIASIWKQKNQTKHAELIAEEGAKLYDKFVNFLQDLEKLGERLDGARKLYDDSMNKLKTGRGNLISKVENMKKLGLNSKSGKTLPPTFENYESKD